MGFDTFYNNWVDISNIFIDVPLFRTEEYLPVNLELDFFQNLSFSPDKFTEYRIQSAIKASNILGPKPAVCFSGGIDSQAMTLAWKESGLNFDTVILVFKDNLNIHDVDDARAFCKINDIPLTEIELDIMQFLNRENYDYALKYDSASPHFNTHYKLFNILKANGYTGVCAGGDAPIKNDNIWGGNFLRNQHTYIKYSQVENFPVIGNYLSYTPELAWCLSLFCAPTSNSNIFFGSNIENLKAANFNRYKNKCDAYKKVGFNILPQKTKYTGFELIKEELERKTGNGWEFEHRYRYPLEKVLNHSSPTIHFKFKEGVEEFVNLTYSNNISSGF